MCPCLIPAQEAGASTLDLGIISDAAGIQGLTEALDSAISQGADVLLTSGIGPSYAFTDAIQFANVRMKWGRCIYSGYNTVLVLGKFPQSCILLSRVVPVA